VLGKGQYRRHLRIAPENHARGGFFAKQPGKFAMQLLHSSIAEFIYCASAAKV
jgi:hypothetical protein